MNEQEVRKILKKVYKKGWNNAREYSNKFPVDDTIIFKSLASLKVLEPKVEDIEKIIIKNGHRVCTSDGQENKSLKTVIIRDLSSAIVKYLKGEKDDR